MSHKFNVTLSLDLDWAIDEVIEDTLDLLRSHNRPATLFCTNGSPALSDLALGDQFELAIHPNFNPLLSNTSTEDYLTVLKNLLTLFPTATGIRSHSLVQSSPILYASKELGLQYDSNLYHPDQAKPYVDFSGLVRFTHGWTDLGHLLDKDDFELASLRLKPDQENILCFHPIHIFLNTPTDEFYQNAKKYYKDYPPLKECKNTSGKGIRDLFLDILRSEQFEFTTLYQRFKQWHSLLNVS